MAIQDDAKNFLLSALSRTGGDLPSLQIAWLATQGYTTGTIDDRWKAYLSANAYYLPEGLSRLLVGLNLAVGNNWLPNLLYQEGDILLWYDPSDLTTMFKDTAGTQPVTADGDSVALMLDKGQWGGKTLEQVLAAQPELESGFGPLATSGDTTSVHPGAVVGKKYYWDVEITDYVSGTFFFNYGDVSDAGLTPPEGNQQFTSNGRRTFMLTAPANTVSFRVRGSGGPVATVTIHAIREIPGYHRTQATGTSMPKYKTGPNPAAAVNSAALTLGAWATGQSTGTGTATPAGEQVTLVGTDASNRGRSYRTFSATSGVTYAVEYTCSITSGGGFVSFSAVANTAGWGPEQTIPLVAGTRTFLITAGATATGYINLATSSGGGNLAITINSVKEIPASAPYIHWLLYDGTDDSTQTPTIPFGTVTSDGAARRNLLTEPDKFDHSTWAKVQATVAANYSVAPDGTTTADKLVESTANALHYTYFTYNVGGVVTFSCYLKAAERSQGTLYLDSAAGGTVVINLSNGTLTTTTGSIVASATVTDVDNGWWRVSLTTTNLGAATNRYPVIQIGPAGGYLGDGTSGIYIWGAQLELGSTATAFQNIGTDEVAACVGVTKSSDAAAGVVAELSASSSANTGTFGLFAPSTAAANYQFRSKGSTDRTVTLSPYSSPITNVLTAQGDISADDADVRVDGVLDAGTPSGAAGTGNFGDFVLNFGRRNNASLPFNGREYQTVIRSRLLSASELSSLETFVAAKSGVIL